MLPDRPVPKKQNNNSGEFDPDVRALRVDNLHYHGNDLAEIRRISESNPQLAEQIVSSIDSQNKREEVSYRFGLITTSILLITIFVAFAIIATNVGTVTLILILFGILFAAVLVRVILTGEWTESSMLGKIVASLTKILGGSSDS